MRIHSHWKGLYIVVPVLLTAFLLAATPTSRVPAIGANTAIFLPAVSYDSGGEPATSVAVADVNGDGKPDMLVANFCATNACPNGAVGVLLGEGDGTFQAAIVYDSGGGAATSLAVADVNGDAKPDLLVTNFDSNTVGVLLGNGDGTFQIAMTYVSGVSGGSNPYSVAVADVNGDGKADLVVANYESVDYLSKTIGVLLGNGDGTFQSVVMYSAGVVLPVSIAVADVNGDGKPDVLVASFWTSFQNLQPGVGVLLGNGDGSFQSGIAYTTGAIGGSSSGGSVAVADVNHDGNPDLLVANEGTGTVGVLLGNGDGTLPACRDLRVKETT